MVPYKQAENGLETRGVSVGKKTLGVGTSIFQFGCCLILKDGVFRHPLSSIQHPLEDPGRCVFYWFVFSDNYILYNIFICKYVPPLGRLLLYLDSFKVIVFNILYLHIDNMYPDAQCMAYLPAFG